MARQKIKVSLLFTRGSGGFDERRPFSLRITDEASRVKIMEFDLLPEDFADLMSNKQTYATADAVDTEAYDHVGRELLVDTEAVPDAAMPESLGARTDEAACRVHLAGYAEARRQAVGADHVRVDQHRGNRWSLRFSTWRPREEQG